MDQFDRGTEITGEVRIAPVHQGNEGRRQVSAFLGESVFVANWSFLIRHFVEDLVLDEPLKPIRQQVAGDAKVLVELIKSANSAKRIAKNQQRPSIADNFESGSD